MSEAFDWIAQRLLSVLQLILLLAVTWFVFAVGWALANWTDPGLATLKGVLADL
jgi:hypothetical protein